ncbi:MAG: hypothetical protein IPH13_09420 [Planctomycetes bacterium]|nr:hypothetical protein [Planctomycetota bacterium]MCC7171231.1 hypothetical protein [Planctomycetota bacterium]
MDANTLVAELTQRMAALERRHALLQRAFATCACVLAATTLFAFTHAQNAPTALKAKSLEIVDDNGFSTIVMASSAAGPAIGLYVPVGGKEPSRIPAVAIGATADSSGIHLSDSMGRPCLELSASIANGVEIGMRDHGGPSRIRMRTSGDRAASITLSDFKGNDRALLLGGEAPTALIVKDKDGKLVKAYP